VRSLEGMSAYLVLKLSTEPFSDVVDEPAEEAVKQAWDINGFAKAERPKAGQIQVCRSRMKHKGLPTRIPHLSIVRCGGSEDKKTSNQCASWILTNSILCYFAAFRCPAPPVDGRHGCADT
jgi:hypothetical protein